MKGINNIAFATNKVFNDSLRCVASAISIATPCNNCVTERVRSRIDLVITKGKEVINSQNEIAFTDVSQICTRPLFKLIFSRPNTIVAKMSSKSTNPFIFSTYRVRQESDKFFFRESGACSLIETIKILCQGSEKLKI